MFLRGDVSITFLKFSGAIIACSVENGDNGGGGREGGGRKEDNLTGQGPRGGKD